MKEDNSNHTHSAPEEGGRVIKMIPSYSVTQTILPGDEVRQLNRNLENLIAKMDNTILQKENSILAVPSQKGVEFVDENSIVTCQAKGSYTEITLDTGAVITDSKGLRHYQRELNSSYFFRTNRAWIVNLGKVVRFFSNTNELETRNGAFVPVSRDLVCEVKKRIVNLR